MMKQFNRCLNTLERYEQNYTKVMAISYALVGSLVMTTMYLCVGLIKKDYTGIQIVNSRAIIGLILNSLIGKSQKVEIYTKNQTIFSLLVLRGILGGVSMFCTFQCLTHMNMSEGVVLVNMNPIWTNLLAITFLGEGFSKRTLIFSLISFVGIIVVTRPPFLFGDYGNSDSLSKSSQLIGATFGIFGSIIGSFISIILTKLSKQFQCKGVMQMQYNFYISIFFTSMVMMNSDHSTAPITLRFVFISTILGLCSVVGSLLLTKAMTIEKTSLICPLQYTQVVFSFLADFFILKADILGPSIIGVALIILGSIGVLV